MADRGHEVLLQSRQLLGGACPFLLQLKQPDVAQGLGHPFAECHGPREVLLGVAVAVKLSTLKVPTIVPSSTSGTTIALRMANGPTSGGTSSQRIADVSAISAGWPFAPYTVTGSTAAKERRVSRPAATTTPRLAATVAQPSA